MEELSEYMVKFEKIKRLIYNFKNDLCPICDKSLKTEVIMTKSKVFRTSYKCVGCGLSFWENQFYETYFDVIVRVVDG